GIDEERPGPRLTAVGRLEDTAVLLRTRREPDRAREHDVRVGRVDDDAREAAGVGQAHVLPGRAGVGGLVDAVAGHVAVADDPRFARTDPDRVVVGRRDGDGTDGLHRLVVEHWDHGLPAVSRFPHAARR